MDYSERAALAETILAPELPRGSLEPNKQTADAPEKMYWRGVDIETMPREKLLEIIRHLAKQVASERESAMSMNETWAAIAKASRGVR